MSSSFDGYFDQLGGDSFADSSTQLFENGTYGGAYNSFSNFPDSKTVAVESPIYAAGGDFPSDQPDFANGEQFSGGLVASDGPIMDEMQPEEGSALREWRRQNAVHLEEKEKREKELVNQIIDAAEKFKIKLSNERKVTCETKKSTNRDREKIFVVGQEKFHAEADKGYWKAIAELIPNEVAAIEKKRGKKKDEDKKPSVVVIQGPKPGKPTDLSRMRQILVKLKHNAPSHLLHPSAEAGPSNEPKADASVATSSEPLAVA